MKQISLLFILIISILGCTTKNQKGLLVKGDGPDAVFRNESGLTVQDTSLYDKTFLEGLTAYKKPLKLAGNFVITENDTIRFPENPPFNSKIIFSTVYFGKKYHLTVSRTNLSTINYNFRLTEKDKSIVTRSGRALLESLFFLGTETDEDSKSGEGYSSYEFWDRDGDCWLSLRLSRAIDNQGKLRAKIIIACKEQVMQELELRKCPTLRSE